MYNRNPTLKHMIVRVRRDPAVFDKYQHNKELVALVNMFADNSQDLPTGWDTKKDRNAKVGTIVWCFFCFCLTILIMLGVFFLVTNKTNWQQFFIDHTHKKTTYMDPRVPTEPATFTRRLSDDAQVSSRRCLVQGFSSING